VLSDIVMKLLKWQMKDRYQSATGLLSDLEDIESFNNKERNDGKFIDAIFNVSMELSDHVPVSTFYIPEVLLRRGQDLKVFVNAMESVQETGRSRSIFLSGPPGIGKSAFLAEAENYSIARRAFFIQDSAQGSDGIPYSTISRVMETIAVELSSLDLQKKLTLSNYISDSLGGIGKLLTTLAPSLVVYLLPSKTLESYWKSK
jgi:chromosomal replication initiation ATPase DnaA